LTFGVNQIKESIPGVIQKLGDGKEAPAI